MKPGRKLTRMSGGEAIAAGSELRGLIDKLKASIPQGVAPWDETSRAILGEIYALGFWLSGDRDNRLIIKKVTPTTSQVRGAYSAPTMAKIAEVKALMADGVGFIDACRAVKFEFGRMDKYLLAEGFTDHVEGYQFYKDERAEAISNGYRIARQRPQQDKITDEAIAQTMAMIDAGYLLKKACKVLEVCPRLMGMALAAEDPPYTVHLDRNKERIKARAKKKWELRRARLRAALDNVAN